MASVADVEPVGVDVAVEEILGYWLGESMRANDITPATPIAPNFSLWFSKNADVDAFLRARFADPLIPLAVEGKLAAWEETPRGALALVILLDQFSRNCYRASPKSFEQDPLALAIAKRSVAKGFDHQVPPIAASFFYLPYEHSEALSDQDSSIELFTKLVDLVPEQFKGMADNMVNYAHKHRDIIVKFGRYPHRNEVVGRESTPEEVAFVKEHGGF